MTRTSCTRELDRIAKEAFRFRLPRRWSFQRLEQNYGIGSRIEIRNEQGGLTDLSCYVQLTATDARESPRALTLRLPKQRFQYYASMEPPVLMVRYRLDTGRFYARWARGNDMAGFRSVRPRGSESPMRIRFVWAESDRWDERSASRFEQDLRLVRQLSAPGFPWPIRFAVRIEWPALPDRARAGIASAIRKQLARLSRYVALVEDARDAQGSISLSGASLRAAIGGIHAVTIRPREACPSPDDLLPVLTHVPFLIALVLTRAGQVETAARMCRLCTETVEPEWSS